MTKMPEDIALTITPKGRPFFSLNGKYAIDSETSFQDLQDDVGCLMESSTALVQVIIDGLAESGSAMHDNPEKEAVPLLYGLLYQLQMVHNLVGAIEVKK